MFRPLILVVESQARLRKQSVAAIRAGGFDTIDVAYAEAAVGILESDFGVRVVFTDVHMRGDLDGVRLGHLVRTHWPAIELVVTADKSLPKGHELPANSQFILKPYSAGDLVHVLRGFRLWRPQD